MNIPLSATWTTCDVLDFKRSFMFKEEFINWMIILWEVFEKFTNFHMFRRNYFLLLYEKFFFNEKLFLLFRLVNVLFSIMFHFCFVFYVVSFLFRFPLGFVFYFIPLLFHFPFCFISILFHLCFTFRSVPLLIL